jgi:hypothetical protein
MSGSIQDSLRQLAALQAAIPNQRDMPPISLPRAPEQRANPWEALTRMGFAMASSRNPSLFGQIGEAGLNMQDMQRQQRRDTREENELELNRVFREAQLNFQREQMRGDPTRLALAQAQLHEAQARLTAAERAGANAGREGQYVIPNSIHEGPNGNAWERRRDGTSVDTGVPIDSFPGVVSRRERTLNDYRQRRQAYENTLRAQLFPRPDSGMPVPPDRLRMFTDEMLRWTAENPEPTAPSTNNRPPVVTPTPAPTIRIDPAGRPIQ